LAQAILAQAVCSRAPSVDAMKLFWLLGLTVRQATAFEHKGTDFAARLQAEGEEDAAAGRAAGCWCEELGEALEWRERDTDSQLRFLNTQGKIAKIDNQKLRHQVSGHIAEAERHQQSLDTHSAITGRKNKDYEDEREFHESALKGIREAIGVIPEGSGGQVRGALRGLEQTFSDKLEESTAEQKRQANGLQDAKRELLRLAKEGAKAKQKRLAKGLQDVERTSAQAALYSERRDADLALGNARRTLCSSVEEALATRLRLRQQALIAFSKADAEVAQAAAARAASKVVALVGGQANATAMVSKGAATGPDFQRILGRTNKIEAGLMKVLDLSAYNGHSVASSGRVNKDVKSAVASLQNEVDANLEATPGLFAAVRSTGQKSLEVDTRMRE